MVVQLQAELVDQLLVLEQFAGVGAASPDGGGQVAGMVVVEAAASKLDFQAASSEFAVQAPSMVVPKVASPCKVALD